MKTLRWTSSVGGGSVSDHAPSTKHPGVRYPSCGGRGYGWIGLLLLFATFLGGCATHRPPQRYAWVTGLKPEKAEYYRDLHAHPWPAVNRTLKDCHIRNFSIHECTIDGKLYLFAYLEYTGMDFEADMERMAADPETQRWWKETDPCQSPLPAAAAEGKIWADTRELYFLK